MIRMTTATIPATMSSPRKTTMKTSKRSLAAPGAGTRGSLGDDVMPEPSDVEPAPPLTGFLPRRQVIGLLRRGMATTDSGHLIR